jgi:hypothetical protein
VTHRRWRGAPSSGAAREDGRAALAGQPPPTTVASTSARSLACTAGWRTSSARHHSVNSGVVSVIQSQQGGGGGSRWTAWTSRTSPVRDGRIGDCAAVSLPPLPFSFVSVCRLPPQFDPLPQDPIPPATRMSSSSPSRKVPHHPPPVRLIRPQTALFLNSLCAGAEQDRLQSASEGARGVVAQPPRPGSSTRSSAAPPPASLCSLWRERRRRRMDAPPSKKAGRSSTSTSGMDAPP